MRFQITVNGKYLRVSILEERLLIYSFRVLPVPDDLVDEDCAVLRPQNVIYCRIRFQETKLNGF